MVKAILTQKDNTILLLLLLFSLVNKPTFDNSYSWASSEEIMTYSIKLGRKQLQKNILNLNFGNQIKLYIIIYLNLVPLKM